ncbi:hypothetical protein CBS63078_7998 [Aspergillus niger]|nr:hypothetical protein ASPNIDRAFT_43723 [Aspergillus niger ATCC 1015]KAI2819495.1 hypothetical protein CBS115989_4346 [Aspergillus niger]RDH20724.1 hypothetical protein M747DRAFT_305202 [Aspergillus niger ATCC 13496]RDK42476.1 hypothetical protein M752DRAFT_300735 [Aspergillus phoenicis ATCC 13157]KAI2829333.1 hypothetical protein CBS133816_4609 [Aspergillus niger]
MKIFQVFLYAVFWAALGKASDNAVLFEVIYYYYAYQIEAGAFADADRFIAPECHPATGTICTFNEFLKAITSKDYPPKLIEAGDTTSPAIEDADTTFSAMKWDNEYEVEDLWRDGARLNHMAVTVRVTNRIQEAREVQTVDSNLLSKAKEALEVIQEKRWEENFEKVAPAFQNKYKGVTLYETETTVDDTKVKVIDWVKTAAVQASKSSSKSKVLLKRYQDWVKSNKGYDYRYHQNIARNIAGFRNVLDAEPSCRAEIGNYARTTP